MARYLPGEYVRLWSVNGESQFEGAQAQASVFHDGSVVISVNEFDGRRSLYKIAPHLWQRIEQGALAAPPSGLAS